MAGGGASLLARWGLPLGLGETAILAWPERAHAGVRLNTADISNFTQVGTQAPTPGPTILTFDDKASGDTSGLFANDPDAGPNAGELDLTATFLVRGLTAFNADADFRVVMNDGATKSAICACVVIGNVNGFGLAGPGLANDPATYLAFAAHDWTQNPPVTIKVRRTSDGGVELMEINGTPPSPRCFLTGLQVAGRTRAGTTAELGCFSPEGLANVEVNQFFTEKVAKAVAGRLTFTRFRVRDTDSTDKLAFRADYTLGVGTNGIDPVTEPVVINLSNGAGQFYSQTLSGFTVTGSAPRRRWVLNDSERARTGIEQLDEDPNNSGGIFLRDARTDVGTADFSTVSAEITIGAGSTADKLGGTAALVQKPAASGKWRLSRKP